MANEILQDDVLHVSTTSIRFYHHHLVRFVGVYVSVHHIRDIDVDAERAERGATAPVAIYVLNKDVVGRTLVISLTWTGTYYQGG